MRVKLLSGPDKDREMTMPYQAGKNLVDQGLAECLDVPSLVPSALDMIKAAEETKNKAKATHANKAKAQPKQKKKKQTSRR